MRRSVLLSASLILAVLLASGVAWAATVHCRPNLDRCAGTSGTDTLYGADDDVGFGDWIVGREGDDKIYGRGGEDRSREFGGGLHGEKGDDLIRGGDGLDHLYGGRGADRLFGGRGTDLLNGESQFASDYGLPKQRAGDILVGGPGDDYFEVVDVAQDQVYCGRGYDEGYADDGKGDASYDRRDFVDDSCEKVIRR